MEQGASSGRRVAFFGGSFDPPHLGHLAVARAAQAALGLDLVLFAPVGAQPLKPAGSTASFDDRVAMTRLAVAGEPGFALSLMDAPRPGAGANYTLDTLLSLRAELPPEGQLFCLVGADSFLSLRRWHGAAAIPFAGSLVVASRPGELLDDLVAALPEGLTMELLSGAPGNGAARAGTGTEMRTYRVRNSAGETSALYLLPGLHVEISASQIRAVIREQPLGDQRPALAGQQLLPAAVLDYIRKRGLYL
jgi:nicotinate-nucleotide adenylyltransferase